MSLCKECGAWEAWGRPSCSFDICPHKDKIAKAVDPTMTPLGGYAPVDRASSGFERFSDLEMAQWIKNKESMPYQFMDMMKARGLIWDECQECGKDHLRHSHDFKCLLCREFERINPF